MFNCFMAISVQFINYVFLGLFSRVVTGNLIVLYSKLYLGLDYFCHEIIKVGQIIMSKFAVHRNVSHNQKLNI